MKKEIRLSKPFRHPDKFPTRTSETYKLTEEGDVVLTAQKMRGNGKWVDQTNAPVELTQAQYNALAVKDPNTIYLIKD